MVADSKMALVANLWPNEDKGKTKTIVTMS